MVGLEMDTVGNAWLADTGSTRLQKRSPQGEVLAIREWHQVGGDQTESMLDI